MANMEKVIRALELCVETQENMEWADCQKCPYNGEEHCSNALMIDALALLRAQEDDTDWKAVAMILADTLSGIGTDLCCDSCDPGCGQGFYCAEYSELWFAHTNCWIEWAKEKALEAGGEQ